MLLWLCFGSNLLVILQALSYGLQALSYWLQVVDDGQRILYPCMNKSFFTHKSENNQLTMVFRPWLL